MENYITKNCMRLCQKNFLKQKKTERIKGMWRTCYKITFHNQGLTDEDLFGIFLKLTALHNADLVKVVINDYTSCEVVIKCSLRTRNLLIADFLEETGKHIHNIEITEV